MNSALNPAKTPRVGCLSFLCHHLELPGVIKSFNKKVFFFLLQWENSQFSHSYLYIAKNIEWTFCRSCKVLVNCHCCMRESEDVFWNTFAAGGQQLDSPLWLMGKSVLHVVFNCFNGLGLSTIPFSWLVYSVYLGPTFGSAGCHGLHSIYLECKPITWGLPSLHGSFWIRTKLWVADGWLSPAKSVQVEKMHGFVTLHIFHILTDVSWSPNK